MIMLPENLIRRAFYRALAELPAPWQDKVRLVITHEVLKTDCANLIGATRDGRVHVCVNALINAPNDQAKVDAVLTELPRAISLCIRGTVRNMAADELIEKYGDEEVVSFLEKMPGRLTYSDFTDNQKRAAAFIPTCKPEPKGPPADHGFWRAPLLPLPNSPASAAGITITPLERRTPLDGIITNRMPPGYSYASNAMNIIMAVTNAKPEVITLAGLVSEEEIVGVIDTAMARRPGKTILIDDGHRVPTVFHSILMDYLATYKCVVAITTPDGLNTLQAWLANAANRGYKMGQTLAATRAFLTGIPIR